MFDYSIIGPNDREPAILNASMDCIVFTIITFFISVSPDTGKASAASRISFSKVSFSGPWVELLWSLNTTFWGYLVTWVQLFKALSRTLVELEYNFLGLLENLSTTFQGLE